MRLDVHETSSQTIGIAGIKLTQVRVTVDAGVGFDAALLVVPHTANCKLQIDQRFINKGIATAGGKLLDRGLTQALWNGQLPDHRPEDYMTEASVGSVGVCPSNIGWQERIFAISQGEVVRIKNDQGRLDGPKELLGLTTDRRWTGLSVELQSGQLIDRADLRLGFSSLDLVREGTAVPLDLFAMGERGSGDPRNIFNFGPGNPPIEFWPLLSGVLPRTVADIGKLARGETVTVESPGSIYSQEQFQTFTQIIIEAGLEHYYNLTSQDEVITFQIREPLPLNRIPATCMGHDSEGNLMVGIVDGRQTKTPGSTILELQEFMIRMGAVNGNLGSAGGDVAIVEKIEQGTYKIHNSPANSGNKTRPVPSWLTFN